MTTGLSDYASCPRTLLTPLLILSWTIKEQIPRESKGLSETHEQEERGRKLTNKKITEQAKETKRGATLLYPTVETRRAKES